MAVVGRETGGGLGEVSVNTYKRVKQLVCTTPGHILVSVQNRVTILSRNVTPSPSLGNTKQIGRASSC